MSEWWATRKFGATDIPYVLHPTRNMTAATTREWAEEHGHLAQSHDILGARLAVIHAMMGA